MSWEVPVELPKLTAIGLRTLGRAVEKQRELREQYWGAHDLILRIQYQTHSWLYGKEIAEAEKRQREAKAALKRLPEDYAPFVYATDSVLNEMEAEIALAKVAPELLDRFIEAAHEYGRFGPHSWEWPKNAGHASVAENAR